MPITVKFDPTANSIQAQIILDASPSNDGVMTRAQVAQLGTQAALSAQLAGGLGQLTTQVTDLISDVTTINQELAALLPIVVLVWTDGQTWDDLKTKIADGGGTCIIIIPHDSFTRTITGTDQDINGLFFFGLQGLTPFMSRDATAITIDSAATLRPDFSLRSFSVQWISTAPVVNPAVRGYFYMELDGGGWLHTSNTDAAFEVIIVPASSPSLVFLTNGAIVSKGGTAAVFSCPDNITPTDIGILMSGLSELQAGTVDIAATSTATVQPEPSAKVSTACFQGAGAANGGLFISPLLFFPQAFGNILASASVLQVTSPFHKVTGVVPIDTLLPPFPGFTGRVSLIKPNVLDTWSVTAAGNIALAVTSSAGEALDLIFDGTTWWPVR